MFLHCPRKNCSGEAFTKQRQLRRVQKNSHMRHESVQGQIKFYMYVYKAIQKNTFLTKRKVGTTGAINNSLNIAIVVPYFSAWFAFFIILFVHVLSIQFLVLELTFSCRLEMNSRYFQYFLVMLINHHMMHSYLGGLVPNLLDC